MRKAARAKAKRAAKRKPRRAARASRPAYVTSPSALAAAAQCSHGTAAKALRGERVHPLIRAAIEAAAARLGITLPPASD